MKQNKTPGIKPEGMMGFLPGGALELQEGVSGSSMDSQKAP